MKKFLVLALAVALLTFMVACDDDVKLVSGPEIDVSNGGFFDGVDDTTAATEGTADTTQDTADTEEIDTASESTDTEAAE